MQRAILALALLHFCIHCSSADEPLRLNPSLQSKPSQEPDADLIQAALGVKKGPLQSQLGPGDRTQLFGVRAQGETFVYVFDRSGSMSLPDGRLLAAAKDEVCASIQLLDSVRQFQVILYNERPRLLNPYGQGKARWLFGTDRDKKAACDALRQVKAEGGTEHLEPLRLALNTGADVVFFLSDAAKPGLSAADLAKVHEWNRSAAVIHTIEFGERGDSDGESFLSILAAQHRGKHVFVDVNDLSRK